MNREHVHLSCSALLATTVLAMTAAAFVFATPSPVCAQEASDSSRARELFETGRAALESGRFPEARDSFQASLEAAPRVATAFNLAIALRGTGETLAARTVFRALLANEYGSLSAERQTQIQQFSEELEEELVVVTLRFEGAQSATVFVDGRPEGELTSRSEVGLDAGSHVFVGESQGVRSPRVSVDLERGERREVTLDFSTVDLSIPTPIPSDESSSVFEEPWFWILTGLVVAGLVVTTVVLTSGGDVTKPQNEGVFGVTEALVSF